MCGRLGSRSSNQRLRTDRVLARDQHMEVGTCKYGHALRGAFKDNQKRLSMVDSGDKVQFVGHALRSSVEVSVGVVGIQWPMMKCAR